MSNKVVCITLIKTQLAFDYQTVRISATKSKLLIFFSIVLWLSGNHYLNLQTGKILLDLGFPALLSRMVNMYPASAIYFEYCDPSVTFIAQLQESTANFLCLHHQHSFGTPDCFKELMFSYMAWIFLQCLGTHSGVRTFFEKLS